MLGGWRAVWVLIMLAAPPGGVRGKCVPPSGERTGLRNYGFAGVHFVPKLRAWLYEVPKSGSTSLARLLRFAQGGRSPLRNGTATSTHVGFAVVRHPVCRAVSAFHTAFDRAAFRTNSSASACPFHRFPYLRANVSDSEGLDIWLSTIRAHGSRLASGACGFAYHHTLSQSFFLWEKRIQLLYAHDRVGMPPPPTVLLRLEHLTDEFLSFCKTRGELDWCKKRLEALGGSLTPLNPSRKSVITPAIREKVAAYLAPDFACLGYDRNKVVC